MSACSCRAKRITRLSASRGHTALVQSARARRVVENLWKGKPRSTAQVEYVRTILALFESSSSSGLPSSTLLGDRIATRTARQACDKQDLSERKVFIPVRQCTLRAARAGFAAPLQHALPHGPRRCAQDRPPSATGWGRILLLQFTPFRTRLRGRMLAWRRGKGWGWGGCGMPAAGRGRHSSKRCVPS